MLSANRVVSNYSSLFIHSRYKAKKVKSARVDTKRQKGTEAIQPE